MKGCQRCVGCNFWYGKAGPSLEKAVSMLIVVLVGVTNLERQSAALFLGSRNPLKGDVICGKLQTPSIEFIISVFPLRKCARGLWLF